MGSPSLAEINHLVRTRDRYSALHHRVLHGVGFLFLAFCVISFASFTCFSHPPSPLSSSNSFPLQMFYYLAGLAFFSSLSGLLVAASQAISAVGNSHPAMLVPIDEEIAAQRKYLATDLPRMTYGVIFLTLAAFSIAGAFLAAGITIQEDVKSLGVAMIVFSAIGACVFLQALLLMLREMFLVWCRIFDFDVDLWEALRTETMFGCIAAKYCTFAMKGWLSKHTNGLETL